jgi:phage tail-like protein
VSTPDPQQPLGGEPPLATRFIFEVDGVEIGVFSAVQGLAVQSRVEEVFEGGQNGFAHKLPGRLEWPNIVFTHGLTQSDALFDWMNRTAGEGFAAAGNKLTRSTGAITAVSDDGVRSRSWSLEAVFPVRWKGPDFDGTSESFLTEELEITHHGFRATNVGG